LFEEGPQLVGGHGADLVSPRGFIDRFALGRERETMNEPP
jgi:hypothetical protein